MLFAICLIGGLIILFTVIKYAVKIGFSVIGIGIKLLLGLGLITVITGGFINNKDKSDKKEVKTNIAVQSEVDENGVVDDSEDDGDFSKTVKNTVDKTLKTVTKTLKKATKKKSKKSKKKKEEGVLDSIAKEFDGAFDFLGDLF